MRAVCNLPGLTSYHRIGTCLYSFNKIKFEIYNCSSLSNCQFQLPQLKLAQVLNFKVVCDVDICCNCNNN